MSTSIYLDNAATTQALPEVANAVCGALQSTYGNPSSLHAMGMHAEELVRTARRHLAEFLGVPEREVLFTSGGTEADNLAILGAARKQARRGKHIVASKIEHAAVLGPCHALEREGWRVTYVGVDHQGRVAPEAVAAAVTDETTLVSVMTVNNEVGTVQPIADIARAVKRQNPRCLFHTDAVQGLGKVPLDPVGWGIDLLSVSAHKVHGPKGCGALWIKEGVRIEPLVYGGGQERALRSGTENVPGITGFGAAITALASNWRANAEHMQALRRQFVAMVQRTLPQVVFITPDIEQIAPHICALAVPGLRGEVMVHALAQKGVYVSSGAACSSHHQQSASHVLEAMGVPEAVRTGALRISFSPHNTSADAEQAVQALTQVITALSAGVLEDLKV